MTKTLFLFSLLCFTTMLIPLKAQEKLIDFSGIIIDSASQEPLPFTHILIKNRYKGTIADQKGMFSIVVKPNDSLVFTFVGYKKR